MARPEEPKVPEGAKRLPSMLQDVIIVDSDFHIKEEQSDFIEYIDDPFYSLLKRSGKMHDANFYPSSGNFSPYYWGKIETYRNKSHDDCLRGKERLNADKVIITPTRNLYLSCVCHDELAVALANAYNQWMIEKFIDVDNGMYTPIVVAGQKPSKAAEEIDDRADEPGRVGVFLPTGGLHPPLGNEIYHPIYQAASDNDLPVMMHNASGTQMMHFPFQWEGINRYMSNHATTHSHIHMNNMTDMMVQGIFTRYPDIDFVFQESGIGWIPYMMRRLDNEYSEKREDAPMLEKMPSEYIKEKCYFTSQPLEGAKEPEYVNTMIRLFNGENRLMFSSDYPHLDFDYTDTLLGPLRKEFSKDEIANIYGGNAMSVYGLN